MLGIDLTAAWRPRVGMATVALELTKALERRGVPITLFCSRDRPAGLNGAATVISPYRHEIANKFRWLPNVEVGAGLDAMLYPYWPQPPLRRRDAPPAISFVHDLAFRVRPDEVPWQQRLYLGSLVPKALKQAAAVLVPSAATRDDLLREFPVPGLAERLRVVPEGMPELPEGGKLPAGLDPGYILAVGTVERRKNYARLQAAHGRLGGEAPPLVIAGRPGWGGAEIAPGPRVVHLQHVDDATLRTLYENAAVFAFPSLYEGFGIPLLEAMHFGVPAVIGRAGALPELAAGAALEVDPESEEEITDALRRLLGDQQLRSELSAAGRGRAQEFTWEAAAAEVELVLGTL